MIDQTEEIEACLQAFSKYWKSGTFFTPCSQRSHVGTSTETSSNLLPKVQNFTCSFFCMKDWRFSFVRVDSNLGQLQINIDISRPIFSALKPVKSAILYPRPYLNQDIQKFFFFTDRCDDMCSKRKTSLHSHAKRGTDQNQLLKSCSHMGTLGGKRLMHKSSTRFFAKYTHFAIVFAGSAERGTLLFWNGGWNIRLAALGEELRLPKVKEKCTVPEVLPKAIRYTCTTSLAILHIYTHHPHSVSRCAYHPTTFPFSLNFIDLFYVAQQHSKMSF